MKCCETVYIFKACREEIVSCHPHWLTHSLNPPTTAGSLKEINWNDPIKTLYNKFHASPPPNPHHPTSEEFPMAVSAH
jgi:hypothetical protein